MVALAASPQSVHQRLEFFYEDYEADVVKKTVMSSGFDPYNLRRWCEVFPQLLLVFQARAPAGP
jgi:hypothetical protein